MFTGIVEELGSVRDLTVLPDAARLGIQGETLVDLALGESVAVNGVCLTVARIDTGGFTADVMHETLRRSALGALEIGARVNLERAVTPTTRLGGHIVQGHVDGVGTVVARRPADHWHEVDVDLPAELLRYIVEKGSITIDGVSLTVSALRDKGLTVSLIPETLARTTLGHRSVGSAVNLEVDVIAKHVERLLDARAQS
jgi:riboflavin synthase